jgi:hypothetical protein
LLRGRIGVPEGPRRPRVRSAHTLDPVRRFFREPIGRVAVLAPG